MLKLANLFVKVKIFCIQMLFLAYLLMENLVIIPYSFFVHKLYTFGAAQLGIHKQHGQAIRCRVVSWKGIGAPDGLLQLAHHADRI